jgi:hypothetical protein
MTATASASFVASRSTTSEEVNDAFRHEAATVRYRRPARPPLAH